MKQILLVLVTFSLSLDAMAQAKPTEEQIGRAYGQAVTKATLLGETLVLMEKQCPKLATATDYREILAKDRAQVAKLEPNFEKLVSALVPVTTYKLIESDGGCDSAKLKDRHAKMSENFAEEALGLLEGSWLPR